MNHRFLFLFLMGGVFFFVGPARSAETAASTATLRLADVLFEAQQKNPEIQAARARWEAARARSTQAATPGKTRIDIERMYAPRKESPFSGAEEKSVMVSQDIPFPSTLFYEGRAARKEADATEARYRAKERDIRSRVKSAYAMLYLSRHSIHIFESNIGLMRQFAKAAESKYAVGKASQGDVLKAQVELSRMLNMLVTLEQEEETNKATLNALLNREPEAPLGTPEDLIPKTLQTTLAKLTAVATDRRAELREASATVDRSRALVSAARSNFLPDLMVQYRRRSMETGKTHDAVLGFSVPLWFWKQGAMVREAKAERRLAEAEADALATTTRLELKNLFVKAQTAARLVELYHSSVLPQAEQALKVAEAGYRSDRTSFLDLLDASRTLLDFRLEHYGHIAAYEALTADLERVVGADLEEALP